MLLKRDDNGSLLLLGLAQVEQDASSTSSAQSTVMSSMVTAMYFKVKWIAFLRVETAAITPLIDAYADRHSKITVMAPTGTWFPLCSSTRLSLTTAATWWLNPNVILIDAGSQNGSSSTKNQILFMGKSSLATSSKLQR